MGHKKICFVDGGRSEFSYCKDNLRAFEHAIIDNGLEFDSLSCWNVRRKDKNRMNFIMKDLLEKNYTGFIFAGFDMMLDAFPAKPSGQYTIPEGFAVASFTSDNKNKMAYDNFYKILWPTNILTENACEILLRRIGGFNESPRRISVNCHWIPPIDVK